MYWNGFDWIYHYWPGPPYESLFAREYIRKQRVKDLVLDEKEFYKNIKVLSDGRVYYIDHVLLGYFRKGRFYMDREVYEYIPRKEFLKIRNWINEKWVFNPERVESRVMVQGASVYHGLINVGSFSSSGLEAAEMSCLYSPRQLKAIFDRARKMV